MGIASFVFFFLVFCAVVMAFVMFNRDEKGVSIGSIVAAVVFLIAGIWFQTHRIVPTQYVGVSRNSISQKLDGLYPSGIMKKPFLSTIYYFPASSRFQKCEVYTPAIKGGYGVDLNLCFYIDASKVDWLAEINKTGSLNANVIMETWRTGVVEEVAQSVRSYMPEQLNENRGAVGDSIFKNVEPWFANRGIPLVATEFSNWDFSSEEVGKAFDASIVSQTKVSEQNALLEAAKVSRQRQMYEAETGVAVAEKNMDALKALGLNTPESIIDYLWLDWLGRAEKVPNTIILQTGEDKVPVSVSP
jgi:hypothetical protein